MPKVPSAAKKEKTLYLLGAISIVLAAIFWSTDGILLRPHLYSLPPSTVVFWEHLFGFIVLSPFIWIYRQELKLISHRQWLAVFWIALFGGALGTAFITKAFFLTNFQNLSVVLLLQKLQPIFAIVLAYFFLGEKLAKKFYGYALLAVFSGYFVTFKNLAPNFDTGDKTMLAAGFSVLAAFAFGSSTTFGKYAIKTINYKLLTALRFGLTTLLMLATVLYFKLLTLPSHSQWGIFLIILLTSGAVGMFLYYYGLKKVAASQATLYELAFPVSAIILDYFVNHNVLSWTQLLGSAMLIFAVWRITTLRPVYTPISGTVIAGSQLGRSLGYRTANLDPALASALTTGVYLVNIQLGSTTYSGLLHYGFSYLTDALVLEVLIKGLADDIYGRQITVSLHEKCRENKKFSSKEEAIAAITKDYEMLG
ncbi:EamA family transporter [Candidatus Falkowbacteria bacterium]|nr:EamA family transporter [Candidatus Falkowbacteria bacterium]